MLFPNLAIFYTLSSYTLLFTLLFTFIYLQPVGCDMMLHSGLVEDNCKVCGGNGSTCYLSQGVIEYDFRKGWFY